MKARIKGVVPAIETPRTAPAGSTLHARLGLIGRRRAVMTLIVIMIAAAASQAVAQQRPGMPFIAQKATETKTLQQVLTGVIPTQIPASIPQFLTMSDPTGYIGTYQPGGETLTAGNSFFSTEITANGRSCFTCHQPQNGWEISPPQIKAELYATGGKSVLFQPIDAANCPDLPGVTARYPDPNFMAAHSQLLTRGNFRISLNAPNPLGPQPPNASYTTFDGNTAPQWVLTVAYDPYGCEMDPVYGLYSNQLSTYRRPLPSANVAFLNRNPTAASSAPLPPEEKLEIMWDAREPDLGHQFIDATEFHGQTTVAPDLNAITQGVMFQSGMFIGQTYNTWAGDLAGGDGSGAMGGSFNLYDLRVSSEPPDSANSCSLGAYGETVCPGVKVKATLPGGTRANVASQLYTAFATPAAAANSIQNAQRESIARGEALFSTNLFTINNIAGLNDIKGDRGGKETGTCSTCHSNLNVGDDSAHDPKRLGIMDNSTGVNVMPATPDFPRFAFYCPTGSIPFFSNPVTSPNCPGSTAGNEATCDEYITTDPGKGLITGLCQDLGKMKVPILRGVAGRAPYFHGGNAATLNDVVNFYNKRFNIGLSDQQKQDLINFLELALGLST